MNNTNRALNRILLLLIGIVLLALGAGAVAIATWSTAAQIWTDSVKSARSWLDQAGAATRIAGGSASWIGVAAVAIIVVVIILLILALGSAGGRRSKTALRHAGSHNARGRITITEDFVSDAIKRTLEPRDDVLTVSVTANDVRREPVLHVAVTPRQNTNPREMADRVDRLLSNLALLNGRETASFISVHTGIRARLAHDRRRVS